jgi:ferric-dicitrate binding protein FerR (iron transport regulator)
MVSGARAILGPSSKAWCWSEPAPAWLHLELGQVDVSVPQLRMGQSLTVHTPNASVIVHGTAFTVQVVGTDSPITTVVVREGTVEVREGGRRSYTRATCGAPA